MSEDYWKMPEEKIELVINEVYGEGYSVRIQEIIRRKSLNLIVVLYRVKCHRDGAREWRCKGINPHHGWDYVVKRKF